MIHIPAKGSRVYLTENPIAVKTPYTLVRSKICISRIVKINFFYIRQPLCIYDIKKGKGIFSVFKNQHLPESGTQKQLSSLFKRSFRDIIILSLIRRRDFHGILQYPDFSRCIYHSYISVGIGCYICNIPHIIIGFFHSNFCSVIFSLYQPRCRPYPISALLIFQYTRNVIRGHPRICICGNAICGILKYSHSRTVCSYPESVF